MSSKEKKNSQNLSQKAADSIRQLTGKSLLKHLPWALPPVVIATAFLIFCPGYVGPESSMLQRVIFIFVVIGGYMAGLVGLIFGKWGTIGSYGFVTVLALPSVLTQVLPDPWNRYFIVLFLAAALGGPSLYNYRKKKRKKAEPVKEKEELPIPDGCEDDEPLPDGIFVLNNLSGRVYQLVRCSGELRAYRVGGELKGLYEGQAVDPANPRPVCEKDLVFPLDTIRSVKIAEHNLYGITVRIKGKKNWNCNPYLSTTPEVLEEFIRKVLPQTVEAPPPEKPDTRPEFVKQRAKLTKVRTGFCIALGVVHLPWLFLDVPYKLFSVLALLLFAAIAGFAFANHKDITLDGSKRSGKVDMLTPLTLAAILPMLRSLLDFDFVRWQGVLLWTVGLGTVLLAVFLLFLPESRKKISHILLIVLTCMAFAFSATAQLNYLLDFQEPAQTPAVITDMHMSTSSRGANSYYLTVVLPDGKEMDIKTYKEHYNSVAIGDDAIVITCHGGLGLPYLFVE